MTELQELLRDLQSPLVWMELGGLALCLGLAWMMSWAIGRGASRAQLLADLDNQPALDYYQHLGWDETRLIARRLSLQLRP